MADAASGSPRERYRAQVSDEVKERAWAQLATGGAAALSLNGIARQMGLSGPALYRYFRSRDELITELIRDAYGDLAETLEAAAAAGGDLAALARAIRGWALADPQRYFLIFGTPVPGYHAPDDVTGKAARIMTTLLDASLGADTGGDEALRAHLRTHRRWAADHPAGPAALQRALAFWTRLHGVLSLELAGHFTGMEFDPAQLFEAELRSL